ncbi:DUF1826 domain-containing protein [Vibrio wakamikoensis]|uniref:DUF1826 domain-containing protein n=1 Tax=Vibrio chaetopteri TaxID=3016528 RepID=A0AAU8BE50_9VIBR
MLRDSIAPLTSPTGSIQTPTTQQTTVRLSASGDHPTVLTDIYKESVNIAIWKRELDADLQHLTNEFLANNPKFQKSVSVSPSDAFAALEYATDGLAPKALLQNIAELVDMFCCLFELDYAGLRLATLESAMCPRFHTDKVPCRLVTTYSGVATDWLEHDVVDRSKLGHGSNGLPDSESGLHQSETDIQRLTCGDVALLKGEKWIGNEGGGLVHRSPSVASGENRLLLTLDFG